MTGHGWGVSDGLVSDAQRGVGGRVMGDGGSEYQGGWFLQFEQATILRQCGGSSSPMHCVQMCITCGSLVACDTLSLGAARHGTPERDAGQWHLGPGSRQNQRKGGVSCVSACRGVCAYFLQQTTLCLQ